MVADADDSWGVLTTGTRSEATKATYANEDSERNDAATK